MAKWAQELMHTLLAMGQLCPQCKLKFNSVVLLCDTLWL